MCFKKTFKFELNLKMTDDKEFKDVYLIRKLKVFGSIKCLNKSAIAPKICLKVSYIKERLYFINVYSCLKI